MAGGRNIVRKPNYSITSPLALVLCPKCLDFVLYVGAGKKECPEHGEVDSISIYEAVRLAYGVP